MARTGRRAGLRRRRRLPAPDVHSPRRSRLAIWLTLALGAWLGRIVFLLPDGTQRLFDLLLAITTAGAVAIWYRRRLRRMLTEHARNERNSDDP